MATEGMVIKVSDLPLYETVAEIVDPTGAQIKIYPADSAKTVEQPPEGYTRIFVGGNWAYSNGDLGEFWRIYRLLSNKAAGSQPDPIEAAGALLFMAMWDKAPQSDPRQDMGSE